jgi:hypothetical protein
MHSVSEEEAKDDLGKEKPHYQGGGSSGVSGFGELLN